MAVPFHVNVLEHCRVSPPPDSVIPPLTLPLTYFDIPWLSYAPNRTLFFYHAPAPPKLTTLLQQSLSLTLHHFYPLAGNLILPPPPAEPQIVYTEGDSVSFTVAESNTNIHHLSGNHPRGLTNLSSLLPNLQSPSSVSRDTHVTWTLPLLVIQITGFRDYGFAIGLTSQHAAADERTLYTFMTCWASFCKSLLKQEPLFEFKSTPWYDRSVILDPNSLKTTLLQQWWDRLDSPKDSQQETDQNMVHSTFYLSSSDVSSIKQHIVEKCKIVNEDPPINLSLYETGVCYVWICLLKIEESHEARASTTPLYLGYNASGISRLKYEIPLSYFGCCIVFGRVKVLESELLVEDGLVCATKSFDIEIDRLVRDFLEGGERWICEWDELSLRVIGSPKVDFYGVDFGWGKAEKIEKLPGADHCRVNVISLNGGRDLDGGLEIGVTLSEDKMRAFTSHFNSGLKQL